jgi:hypothetical protein
MSMGRRAVRRVGKHSYGCRVPTDSLGLQELKAKFKSAIRPVNA